MAEPARSELVAVSFIKTMDGVPTSGVATQLPEDNSSWAASGFIKVGPVVGGTPDLYVPVRNPVVQVQTFGVNPNTKYPDWGKAENLANRIVEGTWDGSILHKQLTLRTGVNDATVMAAAALTEPARIEDDPSGYAIYTVDLSLTWKEIQ